MTRIAFLVAGAAVVLMAGFGCKGSDYPSSSTYGMGTSNAPPPPANTVEMASMAFSPLTLTVAKGTTVTWKNADNTAHTSTSNANVWDTGNLAPGASTTTTFNTAGTFNYHCTYHSMMTGTIVVQ